MQLSDLPTIVPVTTVRESTFLSLGLVSYRSPAMLVYLENDRFLARLKENPDVSGVITIAALVERLPKHLGIAVADDPRREFYRFHNFLAESTGFYWEDFPTEVAADAQVSAMTHVAELNVHIGHNTVIEPGVIILPHVIIGDNVIVRAGSVIGSQGFEFKRIGDEILSVAHAGGVHLHNGVEIQANCAISRSIFGGFTELGEDTKLDNLVHIAHNVKIGQRCFLAACAMVAGSVTIGDDVWVGPGASISSEITVGDRASLTIGSVVTRDVAAGQRVSGNFAIDHDRFLSFIRSVR